MRRDIPFLECGRQMETQPLEHIALLVQDGWDGMTGEAAKLITAGKRWNRVPWLGQQQKKAEQYHDCFHS